MNDIGEMLNIQYPIFQDVNINKSKVNLVGSQDVNNIGEMLNIQYPIFQDVNMNKSRTINIKI